MFLGVLSWCGGAGRLKPSPYPQFAAVLASGRERLGTSALNGGFPGWRWLSHSLSAGAPEPSARGHDSPRPLEQQPQRCRQHEREDDVLCRQAEGGDPVAQCGAHQLRVRMQREIGGLSEQAPLQRGELGLQVLHRFSEVMDHRSFSVERRIAACEVILDEACEVTVKELVGKLLPGREIEPRLIEATAEALSILSEKAGH